MKVKTVTYHKVFSLGNYENEKIGTEIEIQEGDDVQLAIQKARQFVEYNHQLNGLLTERDQCERVINNPDDFTGTQVRRAKDRLEVIEKTVREGQQLLIE